MKIVNQKGTGVVEVLVVLLVVVVLGGVGYAVWHSHKKADTSATASTTTTTATKNTKSEKTPTSKAQGLVISEWKVSMQPTSALGTVSYTYNASKDEITLTSDLQKTLPSSCSYASASPWTISRVAANQENADDKTVDTLVAGYYYHFGYPQAGCEDSASLMKQLDTGYRTSFTSIKED